MKISERPRADRRAFAFASFARSGHPPRSPGCVEPPRAHAPGHPQGTREIYKKTKQMSESDPSPSPPFPSNSQDHEGKALSLLVVSACIEQTAVGSTSLCWPCRTCVLHESVPRSFTQVCCTKFACERSIAGA